MKYLQKQVLNWKRKYLISTHSNVGIGDRIFVICRDLLIKHDIEVTIKVKNNNIILYYEYSIENFNMIVLALTRDSVAIAKVYEDHIIIRFK